MYINTEMFSQLQACKLAMKHKCLSVSESEKNGQTIKTIMEVDFALGKNC